MGRWRGVGPALACLQVSSILHLSWYEESCYSLHQFQDLKFEFKSYHVQYVKDKSLF